MTWTRFINQDNIFFFKGGGCSFSSPLDWTRPDFFLSSLQHSKNDFLKLEIQNKHSVFPLYNLQFKKWCGLYTWPNNECLIIMSHLPLKNILCISKWVQVFRCTITWFDVSCSPKIFSVTARTKFQSSQPGFVCNLRRWNGGRKGYISSFQIY